MMRKFALIAIQPYWTEMLFHQSQRQKPANWQFSLCFWPFTNEQMSLKNPALFEYLFMKDSISKASDQVPFRMNPLFKKNSMLRIYRNHCEDLISAADMNDTKRERLDTWPSCYPFFGEPAFPGRNEKLPLIYRCYNPAGSLILQMMDLETGFKSAKEQILKIKVQNSLLQTVINIRLYKQDHLKSNPGDKQYHIDIENKIIFNPGPDGTSGTKDDIKLPINPQVLGLTEQGELK